MWYNAFETSKEHGFYDVFYEHSGDISVPIKRERQSGKVTKMTAQKYSKVAKED